MSKLIRTLHPQIRVLDAALGTVEYTASNETLDCYGEIIRADGWQFDRFQKNAPFVDSHDYSSITKILGKVNSYEVIKGDLVEVVQYSLEPGTLALWAFKMVRDGFLKAVSVGFYSLDFVSRYSDPARFAQQIAALKLDAQTAAQLNGVHIEQDQIELSQCVIGANPDAVARAYKGGCLNDEDLDKFSAMVAKTKTARTAASPADAVRATQRAKVAFLAEIQQHLT